MTYRFLDLSVPLENGVPSDPPGYEYQIEYVSHQDTFPVWSRRYHGLKITDLPNSEAFAIENVKLSSHNGTHVDAPWHYASISESGERMPTIDEMPLDWFFGPGVKLDFRHLPDGHVVTAADVEKELARIEYALKPGDIVLVNTSAGARYGQEDYTMSGCGMGREATLYLTERGIRVAGTDAWGWDAPVKYLAEVYDRTGRADHIWEGHKAGRVRNYCHIEKLHNLEQLPPFGFKIACFPVKLRGGSAGWTRAVAIFES
jgi:kynurenine formamidase